MASRRNFLSQSALASAALAATPVSTLADNEISTKEKNMKCPLIKFTNQPTKIIRAFHLTVKKK
tara:strand:+ start:1857 stop:2048 length:192 start_codon:yes stop_codon:yes gene_type:complete